MPANDIGIDMGTSSCLVYSTGKGLVLKEPTVVVYDKDTEKIKAIGEEAKQMAGHASSNIEGNSRMADGQSILLSSWKNWNLPML